MKLTGKPAESLLQDPSHVGGILLYGVDQGLVRDRSSRAVRAVLGDATDSFRFVVLPREEHRRLRDEALSPPLGGGRRIIRIQDGTDGLAVVLEAVTERTADLLILVEAFSLTARSKLRSMAERLPQWAAIACSPMSKAIVAGEIKQTLSRAGLTVAADAVAFLAEELSDDFARRQSEIEKLIVFAADDGVVDFERSQACCAGQLEASLGAAVSAAMMGVAELADRLLGELEREGATGPGLLAVLSMEVHRVLKVQALVEQGATVENACLSLMPPVYARQADNFLVEVRRWPIGRLQQLRRAIRLADLACKRAGSRDFVIAAQLLRCLSISQSC